jgi:hypothetical protein
LRLNNSLPQSGQTTPSAFETTTSAAAMPPFVGVFLCLTHGFVAILPWPTRSLRIALVGVVAILALLVGLFHPQIVLHISEPTHVVNVIFVLHFCLQCHAKARKPKPIRRSRA